MNKLIQKRAFLNPVCVLNEMKQIKSATIFFLRTGFRLARYCITIIFLIKVNTNVQPNGFSLRCRLKCVL